MRGKRRFTPIWRFIQKSTPIPISWYAVDERSQTLGVGSFHWEYDHLQEVPEKLAERVLSGNGNGNGK